MQDHGGFNTFNCPVHSCSRRYSGKRSKECLREHLQDFRSKCNSHEIQLLRCFPSTNTGGSAIFRCKRCSKSFPRATTLRRHEETHRPKRFACLICKKLFRQWRLVKQHLSRKHQRGRCQLSTTAETSALSFLDNSMSRTRSSQLPRTILSPNESSAILLQSSFDENAISGQTENVAQQVDRAMNANDCASASGFGLQSDTACNNLFGVWTQEEVSDSFSESQHALEELQKQPTDDMHNLVPTLFCNWDAGPYAHENFQPKQFTNQHEPQALSFPAPTVDTRDNETTSDKLSSVLFCNWEAGVGGTMPVQIQDTLSMNDMNPASFSVPLVKNTVGNRSTSLDFTEPLFCTWEAGGGMENHVTNMEVSNHVSAKDALAFGVWEAGDSVWNHSLSI